MMTTTGLVFVSYAGVTKVASVAEEIENPSRNIPLGILGSLVFTTLLYVLIVAVMVGIADLSTIGDTLTPMADVAAVSLGPAGVVAAAAGDQRLADLPDDQGNQARPDDKAPNAGGKPCSTENAR